MKENLMNISIPMCFEKIQRNVIKTIHKAANEVLEREK